MANAKLKCHKVTKSNTGRFRKEWNKKFKNKSTTNGKRRQKIKRKKTGKIEKKE